MLFESLQLLVMGRGGTEWSVGCPPNGQSLICNWSFSGPGGFMSLFRGGGRQSFPPKVSANLPLVCPHHGENAHKWSSETLPDAALNGKRLLMERSGRVPDQWGQGPGGTSQRPYVQLSAECDTVASASFPLINEGRAGRDSIAKCWGDCGTYRTAVPTLSQTILFSSLEWAFSLNCQTKKLNWHQSWPYDCLFSFLKQRKREKKSVATIEIA